MARDLSQKSDSGPAYPRPEHGRIATDQPSSSALPGKPRASIQERSSSHDATLSSSQAGNILRIPSTSHEKDQSGTIRPVKSNKDDGFKVRRFSDSCIAFRLIP